jgi:hypothetical protein
MRRYWHRGGHQRGPPERAVIGALDAADHLDGGVMILRQKCRQIGGQLRLGAIERLEQSHRLGLARAARAPPDRMDQPTAAMAKGERNTDGLYPVQSHHRAKKWEPVFRMVRQPTPALHAA